MHTNYIQIYVINKILDESFKIYIMIYPDWLPAHLLVVWHTNQRH